MKRITLGDISARLGISKMAVSLALRDDPSIGEDTKKNVFSVARELEYVPNRIAKGLASGRTFTIAALVGGALHDDYHNQFLRSAVDYAMLRGYTLTIALTEGDAEIEYKTINKFREMVVDGFLAFHCGDIKSYCFLQKLGIPFVLYTKYFNDLNSDYVVCNDARGGYMLTNHLVGLGHKRISFVYDYWLRNSSEVLNRIQGYKEAVKENSIQFDPDLVVPYNVTFDEIVMNKNNEALIKLLQSDNPPSAIFVCNDVVAASLYRVLKSMGYKIPEDISVAGYEGVYLGRVVDPPLTTISSPIREMGRRSCELLIDKIEKRIPQEDYVRVSLDPVLTIRNSTIRT